MKDLIIEILYTIYGLGAASGLWYDNDKLFIVSDNSNYLYEYHIPKDSLSKQLLVDMDGENEQVAKTKKLDLESIFKHNNTFYLLSSMSSPTRNYMFQASQKKKHVLTQLSSEDLSKNIQSQLHIDAKDLNIEGSFIYRKNLYLFNRGNGPKIKNGIIRVKKDLKTPINFIDIPLPTIEGEHPGFTDAILLGDKIYFLAAIERSKSTYNDGSIGGSFIGTIDLRSFRVESFQRLSQSQKFEGITLYRETANDYTFLLCEDPDNDSLETVIYKLSLPKKPL